MQKSILLAYIISDVLSSYLALGYHRHIKTEFLIQFSR